MRPDEVVRYARLLSELIRGRVEVQSSARRSYRAVVMLTEALFAFGMLKLTSRMFAQGSGARGARYDEWWMRCDGKLDGIGVRSDNSQRSAIQRLRRCCRLFAEKHAMVSLSKVSRVRSRDPMVKVLCVLKS
jgi:hypothetical protein